MEKKLICIEDIKKRIADVMTLEDLRRLRTDLFGKQGLISVALKNLKHMPDTERKEMSGPLNAVKAQVMTHLRHCENDLESQNQKAQLAKEAIDITLPSPQQSVGKGHPLMQVMADVIDIFSNMGFSVRCGPDIETEFYNFDALNVGADHPARDEQDTFYLNKGYILRTQTSPVQIRTMMTESLPLRIISPGRVYRSDHDRTHTPMFHQVEGLLVEPGMHMGHLKGCLERFLQDFFGTDVQTRLRPSFFPFTEPSAEVDIAYTRSKGRLKIGQGNEWLEILGCGMVHSNVFKSCHLPDSTQGFAFGMGLERLAMLKYGIEDIRLLFSNDQRWLDHYGASNYIADF